MLRCPSVFPQYLFLTGSSLLQWKHILSVHFDRDSGACASPGVCCTSENTVSYHESVHKHNLLSLVISEGSPQPAAASQTAPSRNTEGLLRPKATFRTLYRGCFYPTFSVKSPVPLLKLKEVLIVRGMGWIWLKEFVFLSSVNCLFVLDFFYWSNLLFLVTDCSEFCQSSTRFPGISGCFKLTTSLCFWN